MENRAIPLSEPVSNMGSGNGGHDKNCPRWSLLKDPVRRGHLPAILQECLDTAFDYYSDPSILLPLAELDVTRRRDVDGKRRQNRSEAREADCLVIAAIIHSLDLSSLSVGTPKKGEQGFIYRTCKELAEVAGLVHPTTGNPLRKFQRAFDRLQRVGYLGCSVVAKVNASGQVRRRSSAKIVNAELLIALLGATLKAEKLLKRERDKHSQATKGRRLKTQDQMEEIQRQNRHKRVAEEAKAKVAPESEKPANKPMTSTAGNQDAYAKARQRYQNDMLATGIGHHEILTRLKAFPTFENWAP